MKVELVVSLCLAIVVMAFFFYINAGHVIIAEYVKRDSVDNLDFSFSRCGGPSKIHDKILSAEWISNETLLVKGIANPNCETTWLFGDYRVDGNSLTLIYTPVLNGLAACVCSREVEYEIDGLEKKLYDINLAEEGAIY
jgi:hypothetical protein